MKQYIGLSKSGNLEEATGGLRDPKLLIMVVSDKEAFSQRVQELEAKYPKVPSIACVGQSYGDITVLENGISVTAFCGEVEAVCNTLEEVSIMPVKYIKRLEQDVQKIAGNGANTVCIDLCSSNDECVLTTINSVIHKKGIALTGEIGRAHV